MSHYSELTMYRNAQVALVGRIQNDIFWWQGSAATSNCIQFPSQALKPLGASIVSATWRCCWNPQSDGVNNMGVRIIRFQPQVNANELELKRLVTNDPAFNHPCNMIHDVTAEFQQMLADGVYYEIGTQSFGNGVNGVLIWLSTIEIVWG